MAATATHRSLKPVRKKGKVLPGMMAMMLMKMISTLKILNFSRYYHIFLTCQFQFWPPGGVTCIGSKFGHHLETWLPGSAICISFQSDHLLAPLAWSHWTPCTDGSDENVGQLNAQACKEFIHIVYKWQCSGAEKHSLRRV